MLQNKQQAEKAAALKADAGISNTLVLEKIYGEEPVSHFFVLLFTLLHTLL
jgi:hypothetical protein